MDASNTILSILLLTISSTSYAANSKLFREYIGAESDTVKLSDVPINPDVEFHFILAFAIDYTEGNNPSPTDGMFNVFWETNHLTPGDIASIKEKHCNVKFAVSLGGSTVGKEKVLFVPKSTNSWVQNAVSSLTKMIKEYNLDGIDIDYEQFKASPSIFADCIGQLITNLKESKTISFASIAPYEDDQVQSHYLALWRSHRHAIDYVNFQFYAYNKITISDFVRKFKQQATNYAGGHILASFISSGKGGLSPQHGFFEACSQLKRQGRLGGIFVWSADESIKTKFQNEKKSQALLTA